MTGVNAIGDYYTGAQAQQIARKSGVTFGKNTLVKIKTYNDSFAAGKGPNNTKYEAVLKDGTKIEYFEQLQTNKATVTADKNGFINMKGIQEVYVTGNDKKPDKYNLFGCSGFVNIRDNGGAKDTVTTQNRTMQDGSVQKSNMYVCHDQHDKVKMTKGDARYTGN